jgi:hypothetical protein
MNTKSSEYRSYYSRKDSPLINNKYALRDSLEDNSPI